MSCLKKKLCHVQATPRLSEDKVRQCVDPKLDDNYPPKAVAKVISRIVFAMHAHTPWTGS
jgi:hypothetical protein